VARRNVLISNPLECDSLVERGVFSGFSVELTENWQFHLEVVEDGGSIVSVEDSLRVWWMTHQNKSLIGSRYDTAVLYFCSF
jgi:hypothetical protein